jgi:hypothetical protein
VAPNSRRQFLKNAVATAVFAVCRPIWRLYALSNKKHDLPSWAELVDYARWCPTVHNLQPHKIKPLSATEAELWYDPSRLLPVEDPGAVFVTIAMGIFAEHLSIAASAKGAMVEMTPAIHPVDVNATGVQKFASLKLVPAKEAETLDRDLILKRRTSRLHYNGSPVDAAILEKIRKEAEKFDHEFFSLSAKDLVDYVIDLNQQTLFEDLESDPDRVELNGLFRYSKEEAATKKDGLWSTCMCFPGKLMKSVFTHHEKWNKGWRKWLLVRDYKASFKGTATICWFGGKFDNTADWLNAGRMLARNWLLLTKENVYIHPFGSLITNKDAYQKINGKFTQPQKDRKIWMVFRAGYSKAPARSYRLSTEDIIIS